MYHLWLHVYKRVVNSLLFHHLYLAVSYTKSTPMYFQEITSFLVCFMRLIMKIHPDQIHSSKGKLKLGKAFLVGKVAEMKTFDKLLNF